MVLKDTNVTISDGKWMLGPYDKLIREAWMFKVMYETSYVGREDVMLLEMLLHITISQNELQSLHTVDNVEYVVIVVVL